jgi:hypothetical protein
VRWALSSNIATQSGIHRHDRTLFLSAACRSLHAADGSGGLLITRWSDCCCVYPGGSAGRAEYSSARGRTHGDSQRSSDGDAAPDNDSTSSNDCNPGARRHASRNASTISPAIWADCYSFGSPLMAPRPIDVMTRIWDKTMPIPESGCFVYMGDLSEGGYGRIWLNGRNVAVHRVAYERERGPIPAGMALDHKCRVRACWNPDHIEPVTSRENTLRGVTAAAANFAKTHCQNGHEFTEENTRVWRRMRRCRKCHSLYRSERWRTLRR